MPPPPPNEEDMKRYEKEVAELEDVHGIWQYGKYWPDIKELNKKMEDIGFVTPNSDNCYTFKSEYDEKYYFMPDDFWLVFARAFFFYTTIRFAGAAKQWYNSAKD